MHSKAPTQPGTRVDSGGTLALANTKKNPSAPKLILVTEDVRLHDAC
jgi:hypothetical protein